MLFLLITIFGLTFACQNVDLVEKKLSVQNDTTYIDQPKDSTIEIQVRLIDKLDTIELPAYCGTVMFRMTLKYQVINVLKGDYDAETILINHPCPREVIQHKEIENDKTYTFNVRRRFVDNSYFAGEKQKVVDAGDFEIIYFSGE